MVKLADERFYPFVNKFNQVRKIEKSGTIIFQLSRNLGVIFQQFWK